MKHRIFNVFQIIFTRSTHTRTESENLKKPQIAALVPPPQPRRRSLKLLCFRSAVCSIGRGKKANLDKLDTLKRGATCTTYKPKRIVLSELPVPKKGELTRIGHLKKQLLSGTLFFVRKFLKNNDKTKKEQRKNVPQMSLFAVSQKLNQHSF
jgi:hypothetical protein